MWSQGVADQNMAGQRLATRHQFTPETSGSGAHIENSERTGPRSDLDAGGIPAIAERLRTRRGDRSSCAEEAYAHSFFPDVNAGLSGTRWEKV